MGEFSKACDDLKEKYIKYLTRCMFSHKNYFTDEKILSFEEFEKKSLQNTSNNVK